MQKWLIEFGVSLLMVVYPHKRFSLNKSWMEWKKMSENEGKKAKSSEREIRHEKIECKRGIEAIKNLKLKLKSSVVPYKIMYVCDKLWNVFKWNITKSRDWLVLIYSSIYNI